MYFIIIYFIFSDCKTEDVQTQTTPVLCFRMFMDTPEDERTKLISCLGAFRQYWGTLPQVSIHGKAYARSPMQWNDWLDWLKQLLFPCAGVSWTMCTVDSAVYTQPAQSQKNLLPLWLSSNGCGNQSVTTQVHTQTKLTCSAHTYKYTLRLNRWINSLIIFC